MNISEALTYLLGKGLNKDSLCIGCGAIGSKNPEVKVGKASELVSNKFNKTPQCLVITGNLHFVEEEAINSLWR